MRCLPPFGLRVSESCHFKRADESPFAMEPDVKIIWMGLLLAQAFYTSCPRSHNRIFFSLRETCTWVISSRCAVCPWFIF